MRLTDDGTLVEEQEIDPHDVPGDDVLALLREHTSVIDESGIRSTDGALYLHMCETHDRRVTGLLDFFGYGIVDVSHGDSDNDDCACYIFAVRDYDFSTHVRAVLGD